MADIVCDPATLSPTGHTEPIASFTGVVLAAGQRVTVGLDGTEAETWIVIRVDERDGVFHIVRYEPEAAEGLI